MKPLAVGERDLAVHAGINNRRVERLFFGVMTVAFVITVFAGFARTFFLRSRFETQPLIPLLQLHGLVFTSWFVLFFTQTALVATRKIGIHRRLGIAGAVLAGIMLIVGTSTAIIRAKLGAVPPGFASPLVFLTIPLGDMLVFGSLVAAGFYFRRRADIHKRLMLIGTIAILPAAVARLPFTFMEQGGPLAFFGLTDLFIVPCLIYDLVTRGRPHRATVIAGSLLVISHPLRLLIGTTHAWLVFATWLTHWS